MSCDVGKAMEGLESEFCIEATAVESVELYLSYGKEACACVKLCCFLVVTN